MDTLALDSINWDLVLDSAGNIVVLTGIQALVQDAASACMLYAGELWYDTTQGVPYFQQLWGQLPPQSLVEAKFADAALSVIGVVSASVTIKAFTQRGVSGTVTVTDSSGNTALQH
jgi:hypothetical protein